MSVAERISDLSYGVYNSIRHRGAWELAEGPAGASDFEHLEGHRYMLLITFRRDGTGVPTPVWFGLRDGKAYVHTEGRTAKVQRIQANARVRVAPCTMRAKPRGPAAEGTARIVALEEEEYAEAAIQANYGVGRKLYERPLDRSSLDFVYLEVSPPSGGAGEAERGEGE
jgi:PPOX class probable F420-dependent enzyme